MTCLLFSLVCLFAVCFVLFCFKVWWRSLKSRVIADIGGHDPEYPVNDLAIRRYTVIYTNPYTGTQWRGSSKCRKQTVCVELDDHGMSSSLHDLHKGLRSEVPPAASYYRGTGKYPGIWRKIPGYFSVPRFYDVTLPGYWQIPGYFPSNTRVFDSLSNTRVNDS